MAGVEHDVLAAWLTRLQLTGIRDQLDNLLDEAAEKQLTLREAFAMLVEREVSPQGRAAHRDGVEDRAFPGRARARPTSTSRRSRASTSVSCASSRRRGG